TSLKLVHFHSVQNYPQCSEVLEQFLVFFLLSCYYLHTLRILTVTVALLVDQFITRATALDFAGTIYCFALSILVRSSKPKLGLTGISKNSEIAGNNELCVVVCPLRLG